MIDVHCHLEQKDYDEDLNEVVERARNSGLKGIITSCGNPNDFEKSLEIIRRHKNFVFLTASIHPIHVPEFKDEEIESYLKTLEKNRFNLVGVGETGLDYYWIKDEKERERQKDVFYMHIELAKKLKLPVVVHSRDSHDDVASILENSGYDRVVWHFFGAKEKVEWFIEHEYMASFNTLLLRSKAHKKIVKRLPLEQILLETDAPWLGFGKRNEPSSIRTVAERIAEIKKLDVEAVWEECGKNAIRFFQLPIR